MSRARARRIDGETPTEPAGGVSEVQRHSPLDDVPDPTARAILANGAMLAFGPPDVMARGEMVVGAMWRDGVFRTYDAARRHRGTFASWDGAQVDMLVAIAEWEG